VIVYNRKNVSRPF